LRKDNEELANHFSAITHELTMIRRELETRDNENKSLRDRLLAREEENSSLNRELAEQRRHNGNLNSELKSKDAEINRLQKNLADEQNTTKGLNDQLNQRIITNDDLVKQLDELKLDLDTVYREKCAAAKEVMDLSGQCKAYEDEIFALKGDIQTANKEIISLQE